MLHVTEDFYKLHKESIDVLSSVQHHRIHSSLTHAHTQLLRSPVVQETDCLFPETEVPTTCGGKAQGPNSQYCECSVSLADECGNVVCVDDHRKAVVLSRDQITMCYNLHTFFISLYSILKNLVGRDVTKIALPVHLNEPLSFTQVSCM